MTRVSLLRSIAAVFTRLGPTGATVNARDAIHEHARIDFVVASLERRLTANARPSPETQKQSA